MRVKTAEMVAGLQRVVDEVGGAGGVGAGGGGVAGVVEVAGAGEVDAEGAVAVDERAAGAGEGTFAAVAAEAIGAVVHGLDDLAGAGQIDCHSFELAFSRDRGGAAQVEVEVGGGHFALEIGCAGKLSVQWAL